MKGYAIDCGYMGYIQSESKYRLFETEEEYKQYIIENEEVEEGF